MKFFLLSLLLGTVPWLVRAETRPETLAPTSGRLTLAHYRDWETGTGGRGA